MQVRVTKSLSSLIKLLSQELQFGENCVSMLVLRTETQIGQFQFQFQFQL